MNLNGVKISNMIQYKFAFPVFSAGFVFNFVVHSEGFRLSFLTYNAFCLCLHYGDFYKMIKAITLPNLSTN